MFKLAFRMLCIIFNDTSMIFNGKRLRIYTIVVFSFVRTFAP